MILAGDIGGTSSRLALFEVRDGKLAAVHEQTYPSAQYPGLAPIVAEFRRTRDAPLSAACFGVAGPIRDGRVKTTSLPWIVDAAELARGVGLDRAFLINDLEANAYGIAVLEPGDFFTLQEGRADPKGNACVVSAGTGLGEAGMVWDGTRHIPFACEGGHTDFGPRDHLEVGLLEHLRAKYGHVSYERIVSGPGLLNIYEFLRDTGWGGELSAVTAQMREQDPSSVISRFGLNGECPMCVQALDMFISLFGAEAGNAALKFMATAGVYLGGGIAPKIIDKLNGPTFTAAFNTKGRMRPLMEATPVRVILNPKTALIGAARYAALQAGEM
ncbi:MAG: glucokinase [Rhodocyclaceae bacterium]